QMLRHQDRRAGPLHGAHLVYRSDHARRCAAARKHRAAHSRLPPELRAAAQPGSAEPGWWISVGTTASVDEHAAGVVPAPVRGAEEAAEIRSTCTAEPRLPPYRLFAAQTPPRLR